MGRVAMVPVILRRVPTETHHGGKKQTHFTVQLTMTGSLEAIAHMKQNQNIITHREMLLLDAPDDTDPMTHPVDAEYTQPENIKKKCETNTLVIKRCIQWANKMLAQRILTR